MENLVTVTIRSTHYYLVDARAGKLMVDAGWPGTLPELTRQLKRHDIEMGQIRYVMITHHHPDHAGLAQEIKQACGARLIILEKQIPFLEQLHAFYAEKGGYLPVRVEADDLVLKTANRAALSRIGVQGEIVETPGHSDDSVSLVLDSGMTFTGDLHPPDFVLEEARAVTCESWKKLLRLNARMIYPAHGNPFPVDNLTSSLSLC